MLLALLSLAVAQDVGATFEERHGHPQYENPDITAKYESWEKFFEIMFVISCRSKHSTDVEGEAKAIWEATEGHIDFDGYVAEMKKIQAENVEGFKKSCAMISQEGLPKCRLSCGDQHGGGSTEKLGSRDACDSKCEQKYRGFESECYNKVETLGNVYEVELGKLGNYLTCAEMHCPDYPVTDGETCDVDALNTCKDEMVTEMMKEATTEFCTALWDWIYETEARDPATGDPVVLAQGAKKLVRRLRH
jgi:hypothetical protein